MYMEFELIKEKWEDILLTLKSEHSITDISFNTWLKPLKPHSIEDDTLMIVFQPNYEEEAEPDQMTTPVHPAVHEYPRPGIRPYIAAR